MGLCKCPKKRVTNQFCFEHRVNVCEHCLVASHPKCIVQSYLKWLQDSDYEPTCQLCKQDLSTDECVRLLCYHVFHWSCVDHFARELPSNTAPAGYTCPTCNAGLFPTTNIISPVADALRQTLGRINWARTGLGLSPLENNINRTLVSSTPEELVNLLRPEETYSQPENAISAAAAASKQHIVSLDGFSNPSQTRMDHMESFPNNSALKLAFTSPRKIFDTTTSHKDFRNSYIDHDENKYKRRSAFEWVARWFKSRAPISHNRIKDPRMVYKQWFILTVLIVLGLGTLILIFLHLGRAHADLDPLLDPHFNPNIRIGDNSPHIRPNNDVADPVL